MYTSMCTEMQQRLVIFIAIHQIQHKIFTYSCAQTLCEYVAVTYLCQAFDVIIKLLCYCKSVDDNTGCLSFCVRPYRCKNVIMSLCVNMNCK